MCCINMKHWCSTLTALCEPVFRRGDVKGDHPAAVMTTVSVENTETWEHHKKFTVRGCVDALICSLFNIVF
jgi:hypothetical protein